MNTFKNFKLLFSFLGHYMTAGNEHSVHSPFVFKLLTDAVYKKKKAPVFQKIESVRKKLRKEKHVINVTDLGAGSAYDGVLKKRSIGDITRKFAKSPRHGRFLYRLTDYLKPRVMIELGTSLGISAMYQASGNPNGLLYTLEGCPETASAAAEICRTNKLHNINVITGNFDTSLPPLLQKLRIIDYAFIDGNHTYEATLDYFQLFNEHKQNSTVLVFDDIYWSEGMKKAWKKIKADPDVTITIDFFQFGLVFFDKGLTKQNFKLRA